MLAPSRAAAALGTAALLLVALAACSSSSSSSSDGGTGGCATGETFVGSNGLCCKCVGGAEQYQCGGGLQCNAPKWWPSCGDPACSGFQPISGVPLCTGEQGAGYCTSNVTKCQFESDPCNRIATCALTNPYVCSDAGAHD